METKSTYLSSLFAVKAICLITTTQNIKITQVLLCSYKLLVESRDVADVFSSSAFTSVNAIFFGAGEQKVRLCCFQIL